MADYRSKLIKVGPTPFDIELKLDWVYTNHRLKNRPLSAIIGYF